MKIAEIRSLDVYPQNCCRRCGVTVGYHLDCPVCNTKFVGTNLNKEIDIESTDDVLLMCGNCNAYFRYMKTTEDGKHVWQRVS